MTINGHALHYVDEGQGAPVVMVHGNPTWSFYYRDLVTALRGNYRCIVPDHIGCGYSEKPDDTSYTFTLDQRIDDLEALLDALGITENITLVVHDWGGMIGFGYAVRHPERIKRLVIFNTAAFHLPPDKPLPWMLGLVRNTALGAWAVLHLNAFARGSAWVGCTQKARYTLKLPTLVKYRDDLIGVGLSHYRMPPHLRRAYVAPYDTPAHRLATLRFVQDIPLRPGDPAYATVSASQAALEDGTWQDVPVLICWGLQDFVFDHHFLSRFQQYFPRAEVHPFFRAGHYVLEDASPQIVPLVQDFLERHPLE
ncbi:MAG: alpha/beta fold hydrolase [Anaerolineales bacterium]